MNVNLDIHAPIKIDLTKSRTCASTIIVGVTPDSDDSQVYKNTMACPFVASCVLKGLTELEVQSVDSSSSPEYHRLH